MTADHGPGGQGEAVQYIHLLFCEYSSHIRVFVVLYSGRYTSDPFVWRLYLAASENIYVHYSLAQFFYFLIKKIQANYA